jgi:cbb3-type cytochrome oxidase maturation protein
MTLYFLLTGIGFILFVGCCLALFWMVRSGQLDDLETPALRMLADDPAPQGSDSHRSGDPQL